jgi:DDE family transposase
MPNQHSTTTRLREYINTLLPTAHGHQLKAIFDFVLALIDQQTCCQAQLARFFDNTEAASKRLSRLLHNPRLSVAEMSRATARMIMVQLPLAGPVRLTLDWTIEDQQVLLVASLTIGRRAIPLWWQAYGEDQLKDRMSDIERSMVRTLFEDVLCEVDRRRFIFTADRGFASVELFDLLDELGISFIIRSKGNVKVLMDGKWRKLSTLYLKRNQRRRSLGRLWYGESDRRRLHLVQSRARDRKGKWSLWYLVSNRPLSSMKATSEYALRFSCEEGFRDAKRMLGFGEARIADIAAWARMFTLVAIALLVLANIGCQLIKDHSSAMVQLRRVRSRRRCRSELSLVRAVTELLKKQTSLWELLDYGSKLNLEACL